MVHAVRLARRRSSDNTRACTCLCVPVRVDHSLSSFRMRYGAACLCTYDRYCSSKHRVTGRRCAWVCGAFLKRFSKSFCLVCSRKTPLWQNRKVCVFAHFWDATISVLWSSGCRHAQHLQRGEGDESDSVRCCCSCFIIKHNYFTNEVFEEVEYCRQCHWWFCCDQVVLYATTEVQEQISHTVFHFRSFGAARGVAHAVGCACLPKPTKIGQAREEGNKHSLLSTTVECVTRGVVRVVHVVHVRCRRCCACGKHIKATDKRK